MLKYKIGDKVRIRKDLVVGSTYGSDIYIRKMDDIVKDNDYVLTIGELSYDINEYVMDEDNCEVPYYWTEEMIEGLAEEPTTDREKFEGWVRKLSSLSYDDKVWNAFNKCVTTEPDEIGYEANLKVVSDYLFTEKKKMTKTEIEKELGYEIEIVEGE